MEKNPTSSSKIGGIFGKKCSSNFLKLRSQLVYMKVIHDISAKNIKNFFKWKKIQLKISKLGVFWPKEIFRKILETLVISSL